MLRKYACFETLCNLLTLHIIFVHAFVTAEPLGTSGSFGPFSSLSIVRLNLTTAICFKCFVCDFLLLVTKKIKKKKINDNDHEKLSLNYGPAIYYGINTFLWKTKS